MNKEIIIDGVNVAGCSYTYFEIYEDLENKREVTRCSIGNAFNNNRCENENCYYKQLKRKEQYLETICKTFDIEYIRDKETNQIIAKCNKLLAKEQECEEYKAQAKKYLADYFEENKKCKELKK